MVVLFGEIGYKTMMVALAEGHGLPKPASQGPAGDARRRATGVKGARTGEHELADRKEASWRDKV